MNFDCRHAYRRNGIPQRNAGVGICSSVEDNHLEFSVGLLNPVHQLAFDIRLPEINLHLQLFGALPARLASMSAKVSRP